MNFKASMNDIKNKQFQKTWNFSLQTTIKISVRNFIWNTTKYYLYAFSAKIAPWKDIK